MADQLCFSFDGGEPRAVSGVEIWRERRRAELDRFAAETGLPIGHLVRPHFPAGRFSKNLFLFEKASGWSGSAQTITPPHGKVDFHAAEVESCVRLD